MNPSSQPTAGHRNTGSPRRPASKRAPPLPYPELPEGASSVLFWRAAWLRDAAELAALDAFWTGARRQRKGNVSEPLGHAMSGALIAQQRDMAESFKHLVEAGGLLYAWIPEGGVQ